MKPRRNALLVALALLMALMPSPSRADHSDGVYELPAIAQWAKKKLNVIVIPPNHGQLINSDTGVLNGSDPNELTPFNSYLKAIEASIASWKAAVHMFGSESIRSMYETPVYVVGRDAIPPEVMASPDILVYTDESQGPVLGVAVRVVPCLVRVSKVMIQSFSYADMYNVMGQEFGHCLGLQHVGSQGGVDPTSDQKHPEHDIMNGFYTHSTGAKGTHLHCISNLDILALEFVFSTSNRSPAPSGGPNRVTYMPVDAYGDTCELPPANWREMTLGPAGAQAPSPQPSPGTTPTPTPSPTPSSDPSEPPEEEATTLIESPPDAAAVPRASFEGVSGTMSGTQPDGVRVDVALARRTKTGGCAWWVQRTKRFVSRSCNAPRWNIATGSEHWSLRINDRFPRGRYTAMSIARWDAGAEECCHRGTNLTKFRIF